MVDSIVDLGDTTMINGQAVTVQAMWAPVASARVTMFLNETELGRPVYEVCFAGNASLLSPYNMAVNSELIWVSTGWRFVVKKIDITTINDTIIECTALAIQMPR